MAPHHASHYAAYRDGYHGFERGVYAFSLPRARTRLCWTVLEKR